MRYIGDVHGKFSTYKKRIRNVEESVQVGDMGVGFYSGYTLGEYNPLPNPPFTAMSKGNHRFIRGNHDNPSVCKKQKFWIPDGTYEDKTKTFFLGGALSVDRHLRQENYNYWPDEELSYSELMELMSFYSQVKPDIMVTHDCPESIAGILMSNFNITKYNDPSRTSQALQSYWELHKPSLWIFGHWHHSMRKTILGTEFVCLAELETIDI